jgi:DNA primase (bacterial type)
MRPPDFVAIWNGYAAEDKGGSEYLSGRGLWPLPDGLVRFDTDRIYRVAVPLLDSSGQIVGIERRAIAADADPKLKCLFGSVKSGSSFGRLDNNPRVWIVEGLADYFAASIMAEKLSVCAIATPGAGLAGALVEARAKQVLGKTVFLSFDRDRAGENAFEAAAQALRDAGSRVIPATYPAGFHDLAEIVERVGSEKAAEIMREVFQESASTGCGQPPPDWLRPGDGLAARPVPTARVSLASVFPTLHSNTRDGVPTGCVMSVLGPPDSAKTGTAMEIADAAERQGFIVIHMTNDNGREPAEIRWGQRMRFDRTKLEEGDPNTLATFRAAFAKRNIYMPDPDLCDDKLEPINTLAHVINQARLLWPGARVLLLADSIQTVVPDGGKYDNPRLRVIAVMKLLRQAASIPGWLAIACSQVNRESFKNKKESKNTDPLAAGAESASIEFGSDLMLYLSANESGIHAKVTKNKPGAGRKPTFGLLWDKERAVASEPDAETFAAEALAIAKQAREQFWAELLAIVVKEPGLSTIRIKKKVKHRGTDVAEALDAMSAETPPRVRAEKRGNGKYWYPPARPEGFLL